MHKLLCENVGTTIVLGIAQMYLALGLSVAQKHYFFEEMVQFLELLVNNLLTLVSCENEEYDFLTNSSFKSSHKKDDFFSIKCS